MNSALTLVQKRGCPFAERTAVTLALLSLDAKVVEVDLDHKPDWFLAISPLGKVPALIEDGEAFFESTAINEYLVERFGAGCGLIPDDPAARARMRAWVQFDETALTPAFYRLLLAPPGDVAARAALWLDRLGRVEARLAVMAAEGAGPFMVGPEPSLADVTLHTHIARTPVLAAGRGVELGDGFPSLMAWRAAMAAIPAVAAHTAGEALMFEDLAPYLDRSASGDTAKDMNGAAAAPAA